MVCDMLAGEWITLIQVADTAFAALCPEHFFLLFSLSFAISFEIGALEELQFFAIILYSIKTQLLEPDSLPGVQEDKAGPRQRKARTQLCHPLVPQTMAQTPPSPQEWAINDS